MGKNKEWKKTVLQGLEAKKRLSDESGYEYDPYLETDEMADNDFGPPNEEIQAEIAPPVTPCFSGVSPPTPKKIDIPERLEEPRFDCSPPSAEEIQAEVAPPVTPSFLEASPPTPKKIDIPEPLEEPQFDCSPPLAEEIQAGGALSMGIHSNGDAPSTGKSPVEERDNVASPDAKPSEEKESGKKTHSAVRLDICNISEDMLGIHTMWALRREGNLLVYDEDKGYFPIYI